MIAVSKRLPVVVCRAQWSRCYLLPQAVSGRHQRFCHSNHICITSGADRSLLLHINAGCMLIVALHASKARLASSLIPREGSILLALLGVTHGTSSCYPSAWSWLMLPALSEGHLGGFPATTVRETGLGNADPPDTAEPFSKSLFPVPKMSRASANTTLSTHKIYWHQREQVRQKGIWRSLWAKLLHSMTLLVNGAAQRCLLMDYSPAESCLGVSQPFPPWYFLHQLFGMSQSFRYSRHTGLCKLCKAILRMSFHRMSS